MLQQQQQAARATARSTSGQRPLVARRRRAAVRVSAADAAAAQQGTPVPKNAILVVGATGTLGRQVVRRALDEGYDVRCLVRPRQNPADFLRDWGASTVQGDLSDPSSLPATLVGVSAVLDCATARPEESTRAVDWDGKVALIQSAQAMGVRRYVFASIFGCDRHPQVPLMSTKAATEQFLASSGLDYTVLRFCGFMQAVIGNYAVPVLEDRTVWGTNDETRTAYLDSLDAARLTMAALRCDAAVGRTLTLSGPKAYTVREVITLCERLSDSDAKVSTVPTWLLKRARGVLRGAQWARDASDRLAFAEVLASNETWAAPMDAPFALLGVDPASVTTLDAYLEEYFSRIMKKLKEVGGTAERSNFYI